MARSFHSEASRSEAQERVDRIKIFGEELAALDEAGVLALDEAQRRAIDEYHKALLSSYSDDFDIDQDTRAKPSSSTGGGTACPSTCSSSCLG